MTDTNEDNPTVPTPGDNRIADYFDAEAERHFRYSVRNAALAFAIQNQGKGGDPKRLTVAAQTFAEFLDGAANDPVMAELKPGLKMMDGSEPPPHVARLLAEYEELGARFRALRDLTDSKAFAATNANERMAITDQYEAMGAYYGALMRRLAYAGAMTS